MKRKNLSLLLVLAMALSLLTACGAKDAPNAEAPANNEAAVSQEAEVNEELSDERPTGIQTIEFDAWGEMLSISYDADALICDATSSELNYYDPATGASLFVYADYEAREIINSFSGFDWAENYTASEIEEMHVNGILVQYFTHSYINDGNYREETIYSIPLINGMALTIECSPEDINILEKAFVKIEGNVFKPLPKSRTITLTDRAGNEINRMTPHLWAEGLEVVSNENGKVTFEYTTEIEGEVVTRPAEIHVNAYSSGEDFVNAVSGKYWTMYNPWEQDLYGGKFVTIDSFWDMKVNGSYQQYEDIVFYLELPDGNLITGVCDYYQQNFIGACLDGGLRPVQ